jgi:hypothetical protein
MHQPRLLRVPSECGQWTGPNAGPSLDPLEIAIFRLEDG